MARAGRAFPTRPYLSAVPREVLAAGLDFDGAGMQLGARVGLDIEDFAVENTITYTVDVFLKATTGAAPVVSASLSTGTNGKFARYENAALSIGTAYRVVFVRASDGEVGITNMVAT